MLSCFLAVLYAEAPNEASIHTPHTSVVQPLPNPCRNFDALHVSDRVRR